MNTSKTRNKQGFTLIELSIVLVIIGLIVGGVLVGQDLIQGAKIRSQISQIEQMDLAANTFKLKYNCLPGDCKNATTFFVATTQPEQVTNGDGNKNLDSGFSEGFSGHLEYEQAQFYDHLALAQLISLSPFDELNLDIYTPGVGYPKSPIGEGLVVGVSGTYGDLPLYQHNYMIGGNYDAGDFAIGTRAPTALASDTSSIDRKIDDGKPLTGKVVASRVGLSGASNYIFSEIITPAASGNCVTTATDNPYSIVDGQTCVILVKAGF